MVPIGNLHQLRFLESVESSVEPEQNPASNALSLLWISQIACYDQYLTPGK
jgi:hypothetical protein